MRPPTLEGTIERRLLISYRADPDIVRTHLPTGSRHTPSRATPSSVSASSNSASTPPACPERSASGPSTARTATPSSTPTDNPPSTSPAETPTRRSSHPPAGDSSPAATTEPRITATEDEHNLRVTLDSRDDLIHVTVKAHPTDQLPGDSVFADPATASAFFEHADTGYSDTTRIDCLDALILETANWSATPLAVDEVDSSYFDNSDRFPEGSITLDHGLLMRDIHHTWHPQPRLHLPHTTEPATSSPASAEPLAERHPSSATPR